MSIQIIISLCTIAFMLSLMAIGFRLANIADALKGIREEMRRNRIDKEGK